MPDLSVVGDPEVVVAPGGMAGPAGWWAARQLGLGSTVGRRVCLADISKGCSRGFEGSLSQARKERKSGAIGEGVEKRSGLEDPVRKEAGSKEIMQGALLVPDS